MKKATSKKARRAARKLFPKVKRNEHVFSSEDYKVLPKQ